MNRQMIGAIGLAISSFTGRKVIAVPVIVVGYLVTEGLVNTIAFALGENRMADWITFLSPATICFFFVATRLFFSAHRILQNASA